MQIEEVRMKKKQLEEEFTRMLSDFKGATGVNVTHINLVTHSTMQIGSGPKMDVHNVQIEITL